MQPFSTPWKQKIRSVKYNIRNILHQNYAENENGKLVPDHFLFLKNVLYKVKASI